MARSTARAALVLAALLALSLVPATTADHTRCPEDNPDLCYDPILIEQEHAYVSNWYLETHNARLDGPRVLTPPPGTSVPVEGSVVAAAFLDDASVVSVRMLAGPIEGRMQEVGVDNDPSADAEVPVCRECGVKRGVWQFEWDVGDEAQGYRVMFEATTRDGETFPFAQAHYWPDIAPTFVLPRNTQVVGPVGKLVASVPAPSTTDVTWSFYRLPIYPLDGSKGLPKKDQHKEGDTLSSDTDGDGSKGDMSCAPTAAASSLAWFAKTNPTKYGGLMEWTGPSGPTGGGAMTNKDLVNVIGLLAGTDDGGTAPASLTAAIQAWLDYKLGAGKMKATYTDGVVNLGDVAKEFNRGQDVLVGLYWNGGGAHRVAVNNVVANGDGSYDVTIMDPWNGTYQKMRVKADGTTTYGGGASVQRMIHVSPVEAAPVPATTIPSLAPYLDGSPYAANLWSTPHNGDFMIVATAANGGGAGFVGNVGFGHVLVTVDQSDPDP